MKQDVDTLMVARDLDGLVVSGKLLGNAPLHYMVNGANLVSAMVVKKRGSVAVVVVSPIEREEANAAGLPVVLNTKYNYRDLLRTYDGDILKAQVEYLKRILTDQDIVKGRVGFYGMQDQGGAYVLLRALQESAPHLEIVGELSNSVLTEARATKDAREVNRIREMRDRTVAVVEQTVAFLQQHTVGADETLRQADGSVLTVGDVHAHIAKLITRQGMEDPEGFIFSTGRDAGVPHNKGTLEAPMRLGESIIFDIFPREVGGGYFFDMTRTFCLGYAPEPVTRLHQDVHTCMNQVMEALELGQETRHYQQMICACFQEKGHPTIDEDPQILDGYIHSLGHGVGLDIHEAPMFRDTPDNVVPLQPGHVFTIEPGLYYPNQGMGCRLEDVVWMDDEGHAHNLTDYAYDLVVPMGR